MTEKFFTTEGPVNKDDHYCLTLRLNKEELDTLIERKKYFVLHAPRQTGKTTAILNFAQALNQEKKYKAVYVNIEAAQAARSRVLEGMGAILSAINNAIIRYVPEDEAIYRQYWENKTAKEIDSNELNNFLTYWSAHSEKPIILFIDEIDSLSGDTLISVLRQLRAGYTNRPKEFPQTVCLIGVRDVRDYRIWSEIEHAQVQGGSAFNIKAESLRLGDFTKEEVKELYLQHTQATGQKFTDDAIDHACYLTQGQPWLVNALAYQVCFRDKRYLDRSITITKEMIEEAKETIIQRRDTHIDVLIDRLHEPRVREIIDALINGQESMEGFKADDLQYCRDLGLVKQKGYEIANPIYQEILPRELTYTTQEQIQDKNSWYQNEDGSLNFEKLMLRFQEFYRENSEHWLHSFDYKESGPHLLLMAFFQRVINGGGSIYREYALGRKRVDLLIKWKDQKIVLELKVLKPGKKTLEEGLKQTSGYMDGSNATEGHLVIFDRNPNASWDEKIYQRAEQYDGRPITVWGV